MKKLSLLLVLFLAFSFTTEAQKAKSPRMQAEGEVFGSNTVVDYGAPSVKGREIWGGLEAYGKVWRAGANENTTIEFDKDVKINGKKLAAGKYGFFIIPNENSDWVLIFNKKNDAWGAYDYKEKDDAVRVNVTPIFVDDVQEMLQFRIGENTIMFAWEKVRIAFPFGPM